MKILVTGGNGLVGSHFIATYNDNTEGHIILSPSVMELDITNKKSVHNFFKLHNPDIIIHFAAFTDVSKAEEQRNNKNALCWITNVEGTANLAEATSQKRAHFIYISTDNVFSGLENNPGPYDEDYPTEINPNLVSWYGWTKSEGEKIVSKNLNRFSIVRISNPVRVSFMDKLDYLRKIIALYDESKLYPMFDDQYLTLTNISEVSKSLRILIDKKKRGIFHVSSSNLFTPFNLANLLIKIARGRTNVIKHISIRSFLKDNPTRYPQYTGLKVVKTEKILGLKFMRWEETVETFAKQF